MLSEDGDVLYEICGEIIIISLLLPLYNSHWVDIAIKLL